MVACGIATASVTLIVQNHPPKAADQDVSVNGNDPKKIKLDAKDPDDDKLRFVLVSKPSHGRIAQFSSSTGTLTYVPNPNYNGKDDFAFKVYDGTVFSKDVKVSIKIQNNVKSSNDQVKRGDQHPSKQNTQPSKQNTQPSKQDTQTPSNEQKPNDEKSKNDTPPHDSNQQSSSSTQDNEQQKNDQKAKEQQSVQTDIPKSDTESSGDSQPSS